jgi:hypothetical protein
MKQTAVEWLLENLINEPFSEEDFKHNFNVWNKAEEMEKQQSDDYAIEFAEWLPKNEYWWNRKQKMYKKMFINETFFYTTKELLEIFKKENNENKN